MESSSFLNIAADDVVNDRPFRWKIKFSHLEEASTLFTPPEWKHFICMANESYLDAVMSCRRQASFFNASRKRSYTENFTCVFIARGFCVIKIRVETAHVSKSRYLGSLQK